MRTKLINSDNFDTDYGAGEGSTERYVYECPCGKGNIIEEHDNTPGFRDHDVYMTCNECNKKYQFDTSKGVSEWELVER